LIFVIL